jgi:hypothetical protein
MCPSGVTSQLFAAPFAATDGMLVSPIATPLSRAAAAGIDGCACLVTRSGWAVSMRLRPPA